MVGPQQHPDSYFSRLHPVLIVTLLLLTVGLGLTGWVLRPASGGFLAVPQGPSLFVAQAPPYLDFTETLAPAANGGAVLSFTALYAGLPVTPPPLQEGRFLLVVEDLGQATLCTPSRLSVYEGGPAVRVPPQRILGRGALDSVLKQDQASYLDSRGSEPTGITGKGPFQVHLCWRSNGPVALHGAYLNALLPTVAADVTRYPDGVLRQLSLGSPGADTADYTIQSLQQPKIVTSGSWQWPAEKGLPEPLPFAAVNTSETQHESYNAFLSGIIFGVAGGALVSLVVELVTPFRSRQERRAAEPSG